MDSPSVQVRTLFAPTVPHQASSVLFLIENSDRMATIWPKMRDDCLKPLLSEFDKANRDAPIKVFAVESMPVSSTGLPQADRESPHGLHHGLGNVRFNSSPMNRISTGNVDAAINLLCSVTYAGAPVSSHLIIVAASTPVDSPFLGIQQYAWFLLAEKLKKENIYCHLVLARNGENMSSLVGLFDKTRWLEGTVEVQPLIRNIHQSCYTLKFAANPETTMVHPAPQNINGVHSYQGFPLCLPVEPGGVSNESFEPYNSPPLNTIPQASKNHIQGRPSYESEALEQAYPLKPGSLDPLVTASSPSPEGGSSVAWVYFYPCQAGFDQPDFEVFDRPDFGAFDTNTLS